MASSFLKMALGTRLSASSTFQTHFVPYQLFRVTRHSGEMSPRAQNLSRFSEQRELVGTTILLRILKQLGPEFSGGDSKFPLFVFILQNEDRQNQRTFSF